MGLHGVPIGGTEELSLPPGEARIRPSASWRRLALRVRLADLQPPLRPGGTVVQRGAAAQRVQDAALLAHVGVLCRRSRPSHVRPARLGVSTFC